MRALNKPSRPKHQKMRRIAIINDEHLGGKKYRAYDKNGFMRFKDIFFTAKRISSTWKFKWALENNEIVWTCGPSDYCMFRFNLSINRTFLRIEEN